MFATTATRSQGSPEFHREVEYDIQERLERLALNPRAIEARLRELDEEWDIERAIQANAATLGSGPIDLASAATMSNLFWLTDAQMARLQPFFPKSHGKPRVDDRRVLSGIIFIQPQWLAVV
uniref:Uncharacterized protein n=2 Tax=Cereibacter sphaeroides (strain ATCC 17025 / ATH 2.4.3) TaxID=349102 RepID=A4WTJ9_CERS5